MPNYDGIEKYDNMRYIRSGSSYHQGFKHFLGYLTEDGKLDKQKCMLDKNDLRFKLVQLLKFLFVSQI